MSRLPAVALALLLAVALAGCSGGLPTVAGTTSEVCAVTPTYDPSREAVRGATPADAFAAVRDDLAISGPGVDDDVLEAIAEQLAGADAGDTPIVAGAEGVTVRIVPDDAGGWFVASASIPVDC